MFQNCIRIDWKDSIEYIEIEQTLGDRAWLDDFSIQTTMEWWKAEKAWVKFNVMTEARSEGDAKQLLIFYSAANNEHLNTEDVSFGYSQITFQPNDTRGTVVFVGDDPAESGEGEWELITQKLIGERRRVTTTKLERDQERFRKLLIARDGRCAVTGENNPVVLEAAHIVPVKEGGQEIVENGILLRADLHRLFDSGQLNIETDGIISLSAIAGSVIKNYEAYDGKRLDTDLFGRVKAALAMRNDLDSSHGLPLVP